MHLSIDGTLVPNSNQHVANAVKAAETAVEENSLDTLWVAICFAYKAARLALKASEEAVR